MCLTFHFLPQIALQRHRMSIYILQLCCVLRNIYTTQFDSIYFPFCSAEPMKKKKKVDNQQLFAKEMKRRKKLEKAIKRIESKGRKLKPVDEIDWDFKLATTRE